MIKIAIIVSLLIHVVVLSIKIEEPKLQEKKQGQNKAKVVLKDKEKNGKGDNQEDIYVLQELVDKLEKELNDSKFAASLINSQKDCETYYIGIGIHYSPLFNTVINVAPGGPADKAGIRVDDILIDGQEIKDQYPEGTTITVAVLRKGIIHNIPITIGKICTKAKGK